MSVPPEANGSPVHAERPSEAVAGLLAACAIFASLVGIVYRPGRVEPFTIGVALLAAAMGGRHRGLAAFAVVVSTLAFWAGMAVAVVTEHPIF
jgi:hypothetical protein